MKLVSHHSKRLSGRHVAPGDKSISHRALMLGASAVGETRIRGLLEAEDVLATAAALRALGADIEREPDGTWRVHGAGTGALESPSRPLDLGNSGTGVRLLMGLVATQPTLVILTGDESLSRRPMKRVAAPLVEMGARIIGRDGDRLPLVVEGAREPIPIEYRLPIPSAQVKSAILLAGLNAPGETTVHEPAPTRDHTERMLVHFGARLDIATDPDGGRRITLTGESDLRGAAVEVPADPSSAAFLAVASLIVPGSEITLPGVGINPTRTGLFQTLVEMGADLVFTNERLAAGEPVADLIVRSSGLQGIEVPASRAPSMIDEYPVLAAAAACARGRTVFRGIGELRVKESDRLSAVAAGLAACGVRVEAGDDWLAIEGGDGPPAGGGTVATHYDHRIAMSFLILGLATPEPVAIDDGRAIATSFPSFIELVHAAGGRIDGPGAP